MANITLKDILDMVEDFGIIEEDYDKVFIDMNIWEVEKDIPMYHHNARATYAMIVDFQHPTNTFYHIYCEATKATKDYVK